MKKIINASNLAQDMLMKKKSLRDDDNRLVANIWYQWIGPNNVKNMSASKLLEWIANSNLPSFESISRARRKLQEQNPELRGDSWEKRHKEAVKYRKTIRTLNLRRNND
tara:strand:- start:8160 stop:8486 length:327 start_codon:yes stop_codon:yes gene_type:complete